VAAADDDDVERVRLGDHAGTSIPELPDPKAEVWKESVSRETPSKMPSVFHVKHG